MPTTNTYKIGTRGSLLAVTQCTLIKNKISCLTGKSFKLLTMKTQGDQITDKPLWQLEGKDFFTKELDHALINNDVDLVVHSYKDLGSDRPAEIKIAAITERKFPNDILLIKKETVKSLGSLSEIIIGTSSPRRIVNIEKNIAPYLPALKADASIRCETLRGNVNTRIEKLLTGQYHAIVLAHAGLERLACKEDSKIILEKLIEELDFMIMPQKDFPSAASQGALAIECKIDASDELFSTLQSVNHLPTVEAIAKERVAFQSYGGGCHLAVGVYVKSVHDFFVHIHQGKLDDEPINKLELEGFDYAPYTGKNIYFVQNENDFLITKDEIKTTDNLANKNLFVTSKNTFHNVTASKTIWAAGNKTLKQLVKKGYWVNGSAEGFGHDEINNFKSSEVIKMFTQNLDWLVLSHDQASSTIGPTVSSYKRRVKKLSLKDELKQADIIYWSSEFQYDTYINLFPELKNKLHASGLGKTYTALKAKQIKLIPCIDRKHLIRKTQKDI